jgi:8-oxo-dGTP pyrophosphatase MutT (NUDIX family)
MHAISVSLTTSVVFLLWRWQGGWEDDEDVHEAACREALEEAGVRGAINVCNCSLSLSFSLSLSHTHTHKTSLSAAPRRSGVRSNLLAIASRGEKARTHLA